jgi:hypothetical protein
VQLIKVCNTLFAAFKKNRNFIISTRFFFENRKQGMQTARLDELNNIITWANISFIFKN